MDLTVEESAAVLSLLIAARDGVAMREEGRAMERYYERALFDSLKAKCAAAGFDLEEMSTVETHLKPVALPILEAAPEAERLRALAIGLDVAMADGHVDTLEWGELKECADRLRVGMDQVRAYAAEKLTAR